ncbi:hypothetical protein BDW62DRAFT_189810 [Aspergillus aurantiobrunneus]
MFQDDDTVGISFLFYNFKLRHVKTGEEVIASILKQLLLNTAELPKAVEAMYHTNSRNNTRPTYGQLCSALDSTLAQFSKYFIILDALDESGDREGRILSTIMDMQNHHQIHLLATSRHIAEITAKFGNSLHLEIRAKGDDVEKYLQSCITRLPSFVRRSSDLQKEVISRTTNAVDGMFLLAHKAVKIALGKLPSGSDAYDRGTRTRNTFANSQGEGLEASCEPLPWSQGRCRRVW